MVAKGVVVFLASLAASILVELIAWLLIYRKDEYKRLKTLLLRTEMKLEQLRSAPSTNAKAKKKKEQRHEDQMRTRVRQINSIKFSTMLITGVLLFAFYQVLTRMYAGVPVAELPFEPFSWVTRVTHRGLPGKRMREVSVTCIYMLCQYSTRVAVSKVFNFGISPQMEQAVQAQDSAWGKLLDNQKGSL